MLIITPNLIMCLHIPGVSCAYDSKTKHELTRTNCLVKTANNNACLFLEYIACFKCKLS